MSKDYRPKTVFYMRLSADKKISKGETRSKAEIEYESQLQDLTSRWGTPDEIHQEKRSGGKPLKLLFTLVHTLAPGSVIHGVHIDRLTRRGAFSLGYIVEIARQRGITIETIQDGNLTGMSPENEMFAAMKAFVAQQERENTRRRIQAHIEARKKQGLLWGVHLAKANGNFRPGHPPINPLWQRALPRLIELRAQGLSYQEITDQATKEFGEKFSKTHVWRLLKSKGVA